MMKDISGQEFKVGDLFFKANIFGRSGVLDLYTVTALADKKGNPCLKAQGCSELLLKGGDCDRYHRTAKGRESSIQFPSRCWIVKPLV